MADSDLAPPVALTDEVLLAMAVERRAYNMYVKEPIGPHKRAWQAATIDLRMKGGSPNRVQEVRRYLALTESRRLAPDGAIDREARRVLHSLIQEQRRRIAPPRQRGVGSMATGDTIEIVVEEGACGCGCGTPVKRTYAQGHDARLRGILVKAFKAGDKVAVTPPDGKRKVHTAEALLSEHGFPIPVIKPKKEKAESNGDAKSSAKATVTKMKPRTGKAAAEAEAPADEPEGASV